MDSSFLRVKNSNFILMIILISIELTILSSTSILFFLGFMKNELPITTIITFTLMLLLCVPISFILYRISDNKITKRILIGLFCNLIGLAVSGFEWYLSPYKIANFNVQIGMLIMVLSYAPILYTLLKTFSEQHKKLHRSVKLFTLYSGAIFMVMLIYFVMANVSHSTGNFELVIYSLATIADTIIIALTICLILINISTDVRYLLAIILGYFLLSFMGDMLNLIGHLNVYNTDQIPQHFYDMMLLFLSVTLLIYSMNSIKFINIEEVNKKLNDTALVIEDLIMQSPDGMCLCDPEGNIIKMNNSFANIFGILMSEDRNINIFEHQFNEKDLSAEFARARQGRIISIDDFKIDTNSDVRYLSIRLFPTLSSDNIITHFILMAEDITFRKMAEEKLKKVNEELEVRVQERTSELLILNETLQEEIVEHGLDEEKLKVSLKEKEVLLKEIHHRVKNNMQIVSSMLDLQAKYVNNPELTRVFKDSQSRIRSMALIHEKLYMSDNLAKINFKEYTNTLARNLYISFRLDKCIEIRTEVENIWFNIDTSIPLGLIINELVSNSLIHAFQDRENGIVTITISKKENDTYHLIVKDDGIGMKNTVNISQSKTLGLKLVNALVKQINGDMKIKSDRGTCFQIIFSCSEK